MKAIVKPAAILLLICALVAGILAGTHLLTQDAIAEAEEKARQESVREVLPMAVTVEVIPSENVDAFVGKDTDGNIICYAFLTSSKGYGGDVSVTVGFDTEGRVLGIAVNAPSETPGLGSNVQKDSFTDQFGGMNVDAGVSDVDYVTSATYSSKAVIAAVELAMQQYREVVKGGEA